jgi:hypothetical protein
MRMRMNRHCRDGDRMDGGGGKPEAAEAGRAARTACAGEPASQALSPA